jgi:hypothetical protein
LAFRDKACKEDAMRAQIDVWDLANGKLIREYQTFNSTDIEWLSDDLFLQFRPSYTETNFLFDVRFDFPIAKNLQVDCNLTHSPEGELWMPVQTEDNVFRRVFTNQVLTMDSDPKLSVLLSDACRYVDVSNQSVAIEVLLDSPKRSQELCDRLGQLIVDQGYKIGPGGLVLSVKAIGKQYQVDPALISRFERENRKQPAEQVLTVNGKYVNLPFVDVEMSLSEPKLGILLKDAKKIEFNPETSRYRTGSTYNEDDQRKIDLSFKFPSDPEKDIADELFDLVAKYLDIDAVLPKEPFATDGKKSLKLPLDRESKIFKSTQEALVGFQPELLR